MSAHFPVRETAPHDLTHRKDPGRPRKNQRTQDTPTLQSTQPGSHSYHDKPTEKERLHSVAAHHPENEIATHYELTQVNRCHAYPTKNKKRNKKRGRPRKNLRTIEAPTVELSLADNPTEKKRQRGVSAHYPENELAPHELSPTNNCFRSLTSKTLAAKSVTWDMGHTKPVTLNGNSTPMMISGPGVGSMVFICHICKVPFQTKASPHRGIVMIEKHVCVASISDVLPVNDYIPGPRTDTSKKFSLVVSPGESRTATQTLQSTVKKNIDCGLSAHYPVVPHELIQGKKPRRPPKNQRTQDTPTVQLTQTGSYLDKYAEKQRLCRVPAYYCEHELTQHYELTRVNVCHGNSTEKKRLGKKRGRPRKLVNICLTNPTENKRPNKKRGRTRNLVNICPENPTENKRPTKKRGRPLKNLRTKEVPTVELSRVDKPTEKKILCGVSAHYSENELTPHYELTSSNICYENSIEMKRVGMSRGVDEPTVDLTQTSSRYDQLKHNERMNMCPGADESRLGKLTQPESKGKQNLSPGAKESSVVNLTQTGSCHDQRIDNDITIMSPETNESPLVHLAQTGLWHDQRVDNEEPNTSLETIESSMVKLTQTRLCVYQLEDNEITNGSPETNESPPVVELARIGLCHDQPEDNEITNISPGTNESLLVKLTQQTTCDESESDQRELVTEVEKPHTDYDNTSEQTQTPYDESEESDLREPLTEAERPADGNLLSNDNMSKLVECQNPVIGKLLPEGASQSVTIVENEVWTRESLTTRNTGVSNSKCGIASDPETEVSKLPLFVVLSKVEDIKTEEVSEAESATFDIIPVEFLVESVAIPETVLYSDIESPKPVMLVGPPGPCGPRSTVESTATPLAIPGPDIKPPNSGMLVGASATFDPRPTVETRTTAFTISDPDMKAPNSMMLVGPSGNIGLRSTVESTVDSLAISDQHMKPPKPATLVEASGIFDTKPIIDCAATPTAVSCLDVKPSKPVILVGPSGTFYPGPTFESTIDSLAISDQDIKPPKPATLVEVSGILDFKPIIECVATPFAISGPDTKPTRWEMFESTETFVTSPTSESGSTPWSISCPHVEPATPVMLVGPPGTFSLKTTVESAATAATVSRLDIEPPTPVTLVGPSGTSQHAIATLSDADAMISSWDLSNEGLIETKASLKEGLFPNMKTEVCAASTIVTNFDPGLQVVGHEEHSYECPLCAEVFGKKSERDKHVRTLHGNVKPYKCNSCKKAFKNLFELSSHRLIHGEKKFPCPICGRKFLHKRYVDSHVLTHRVSSSKFHCQICARVFNDKASLDNHEYCRNFPCHICGRRFLRIGDQTAHIRRHANMADFRKTIEAIASETANKPVRDDGIKTVTLETHDVSKQGDRQCYSDRFKKLNLVASGELGLTEVETEERNFHCYDCGLVFKGRCGLSTHIATHPVRGLRKLIQNVPYLPTP